MKMSTVTFVVSNTDYKNCPKDERPEFAFIGRSNVGKSSLINMLTGQKKLAKTSSTPGKTQLINHFIVNDQWYLVDLPGYGYAKVSKNQRNQWQKVTPARPSSPQRWHRQAKQAPCAAWRASFLADAHSTPLQRR